jgi:signal transduction histidine kinase
MLLPRYTPLFLLIQFTTFIPEEVMGVTPLLTKNRKALPALSFQEGSFGILSAWPGNEPVAFTLLTLLSILVPVVLILFRVKRRAYEKKQLQALVTGETNERSRIGRELHDGIGAMLLTVNNHLEQYKRNNTNQAQAEALDSIIELVNTTSKELRNTAHNLIPEAIQMQGFTAALQQYCRYISPAGKPEIQLYTYGDWNTVSHTIVTSVFRIVQELVQNTVKHAQATVAAVSVILLEKNIKIIVEDDGTGIIRKKNYTGTGLQNVKARVAALGGKIYIESIEKKGTIIHIEIRI